MYVNNFLFNKGRTSKFLLVYQDFTHHLDDCLQSRLIAPGCLDSRLSILLGS